MPINGLGARAGIPIPGAPVVRPMFRALGIAASGLSAQRERMETIAQNIANADTSTGPDGVGYRRRAAVIQTATSDTAQYPPFSIPPGVAGVAGVSAPTGISAPKQSDAFGDAPRAIEVPFLPFPLPPNGDGQFGVNVAGIAEDQDEGRLVYEPNNPNANDKGLVRYPNIDTAQEQVNLLDAKRLYEANASVFQAAKSMLRATLDI